jgi:hypothetical protein
MILKGKEEVDEFVGYQVTLRFSLPLIGGEALRERSAIRKAGFLRKGFHIKRRC